MLSIKNAVSAIFYVENSNIDELRKNFSKIIKLLQKEQPDIIILFKNWINNLFGFHDKAINTKIDDIQEVRTMFSTALKEYGEKLEKKALEKGIAKGKLEGRLEGKLEGELQGKKDVAAKMLLLDFSVNDICSVTGLSEDEVKGLSEG